MTFNEEYKKYKLLVQDELSQIENLILNIVSPRKELKQSLAKFLTAQSKRIRPVISLLYLKALNIKITPQIIKMLAAIEVIHSASLIHDDIIDESDFRRGEKTISGNFGNKLGVISGDYLLSLAMGLISELKSIDILADISDTICHMCIGEINQNFELYKIGTIEDYIEKSKNKTAYLFKSALVSSLILINAQKTLIDEASEFMLNFGIAFQIRDDLLNLTKSDSTKPYGNDIAEGIYNAPVIYAGGVDNLSLGIEKTYSLLNNYLRKALLSLNNLEQNDYKALLIQLTELISNV